MVQEASVIPGVYWLRGHVETDVLSVWLQRSVHVVAVQWGSLGRPASIALQ